MGICIYFAGVKVHIEELEIESWNSFTNNFNWKGYSDMFYNKVVVEIFKDDEENGYNLRAYRNRVHIYCNWKILRIVKTIGHIYENIVPETVIFSLS